MNSGPATPGQGFPGDPATAQTPIARDGADVARLAAGAGLAAGAELAAVQAASSVCRACPRLVAWRETVAVRKRRAYADQPYWGRPVPSFGVPDPAIVIIGLAPAAHGGNRTGRMFTGDRSGDWLYAALHRAGLANQPTAVSADDGLALRHTRLVAAVRCAPPDNAPTPTERDTCRPWLVAELRAVWPTVRVVLVLGGFGWTALWPALHAAQVAAPVQRSRFGHGTEVALPDGRTVLGCYHVSQQNTFTGRLTVTMLDEVMRRARELAGLQPYRADG